MTSPATAFHWTIPMNPQDAVDLGREAVNMALLLGAPVLATALVVGLVIGLLQAMTQVQEQTVSFVPKLVAMVVVLSLMLPWLVHQMVQYSHDLIANIPNTHQLTSTATPLAAGATYVMDR